MMGPADREIFWALVALIGLFCAVFGLLLWRNLARRAGEERRSLDRESQPRENRRR